MVFVVPAGVHGGRGGPGEVRVRLHGDRLLGVVLRHVLVHLLHAQQRPVLPHTTLIDLHVVINVKIVPITAV
jgi:hypothetical protein